MKALLFETFGGPDVLRYRELPDPVVSPGQVQLAMLAMSTAAGATTSFQ